MIDLLIKFTTLSRDQITSYANKSQFLDAGAILGNAVGMWMAFGIVIACFAIASHKYVHSKKWFFWSDTGDKTFNLISVSVVFTVLGYIACLAVFVILGCIVELMILTIPYYPYLLFLVLFLCLLWICKWLVSLRTAVGVHLLDKEIHSGAVDNIDKSGILKGFSDKELEKLKGIINERSE